MDTELIIINEYCLHNQVEPQFLFSLHSVGLIELVERDSQFYIYTTQLVSLERYTRWYYELSVNVEGIDVMQNLMDRIDELQTEIAQLKEKVKLLE